MRGDDLPAGVDLSTFDAGVNSGPARGAKWLQKALGAAYDGPIDGIVGPNTVAGARGAAAPDTVRRACDARLGFLQGLSTWKVFGHGWGRRVGDIRGHALEWAGESADSIRGDADKVAESGQRDSRNGDSRNGGSSAGGGGGGGGAAGLESPEGLIAALIAAVVLIAIGAAI